jgi:hypothetical protein
MPKDTNISMENAVPLSLSLNPESGLLDDLAFARAERRAGYIGQTAEEFIADMEKLITKIENETR